MSELTGVFAIDLCAYAVMSNHYHVLLRVNSNEAQRMSPAEVVDRWLKIYSGPRVIHQWRSNNALGRAEVEVVHQTIETWRDRLYNLSWFMRCLNEAIARAANREDKCTGRFWESRFHSQALLNERALISCMAYVDLNPIRAGMASTPEQSEYTSIYERLTNSDNSFLLDFVSPEDDTGIPFAFEDYLEFVDWAGRQIRNEKKGWIPEHAPPILVRLWKDATPVLDYLTQEQHAQLTALGGEEELMQLASRKNKKFIKGLSVSRLICAEPD